MLTLRTATGAELPLNWIGVSDFDGSLRFEIPGGNMNRLFPLFNDPSETGVLTRVFDENEREFRGFTSFKGLELMASGNVVVRLLPGPAA